MGSQCTPAHAGPTRAHQYRPRPALLTRMSTAADLALLIVKGKSVRSSHTRQSRAVHLLAAMPPSGQVASQTRVADRTNEISALADLLASLDIQGSMVSDDALRTQDETAQHLVQERRAHYVFTVKANQLTLFRQVKALPWAQAPLLFTEASRAHGREERRTVKVVPAPGLAFAHAKQVVQVHRWVKELATCKMRCTYTPTSTWSPGLLLSRPTLQGWRVWSGGHWQIEALHHVRDMSFGKDASRGAVRARGAEHGEAAQPGYRAVGRAGSEQHPRSYPLGVL